MDLFSMKMYDLMKQMNVFKFGLNQKFLIFLTSSLLIQALILVRKLK